MDRNKKKGKEETKIEEIRIEAGKGAQKYEEKTRTEGRNKIITECCTQIKGKEDINKSGWEEEREQYCRRNGMEIEEVEEARRGIREIGTTLINADIGEQRQEQYDRIIKDRYKAKIPGE